MNKKPLVSIIIPTKNRYEQLKLCLDSVLSQSYKDFEIIIVDDGSTDETPTIAKGYPVKVIRNERSLGPAASYNKGAEAAEGDILVFFDDDAIAETAWLESLVKPMTSGDIAVVTGRVLPKTDNYITRAFMDRARKDKFREINPEYEAIQEGNSAFRSKPLSSVGFFWPKLMYHTGIDVCLKLRKMGYKIVYTPHAVIRHDYARGVAHLMKKMFKSGKDRAYAESRNKLPIKLTKFVKSLPFIGLPMLPFVLISIEGAFLLRILAVTWLVTLFLVALLKTRSLITSGLYILARTCREYGFLFGKLTWSSMGKFD